MSFPLGVVVFISMLKDAFEDFQRHQSDNEENKKKSLIYNPATKKFEPKEWLNMKPGMVVKVLEDEQFPTDILLLQSSDNAGGLFVETKNLDGETNLKSKSVHRKINELYKDFVDNSWSKLNGQVVCEQPNNAIYKFEGFLTVDKTDYPQDADNFLLRGCTLRNTGYIIGLVVFTGADTKIMKNTA